MWGDKSSSIKKWFFQFGGLACTEPWPQTVLYLGLQHQSDFSRQRKIFLCRRTFIFFSLFIFYCLSHKIWLVLSHEPAVWSCCRFRLHHSFIQWWVIVQVSENSADCTVILMINIQQLIGFSHSSWRLFTARWCITSQSDAVLGWGHNTSARRLRSTIASGPLGNPVDIDVGGCHGGIIMYHWRVPRQVIRQVWGWGALGKRVLCPCRNVPNVTFFVCDVCFLNDSVIFPAMHWTTFIYVHMWRTRTSRLCSRNKKTSFKIQSTFATMLMIKMFRKCLKMIKYSCLFNMSV